MEEVPTNLTYYGECRCCLSQGYHCDMTTDYYIKGQRQVLTDMFLECFNIFLSTNNKLSVLICSLCIKKLRDAQSFKSQVLATEKILLSKLGDHQMEFVNVCTHQEDAYNFEHDPVKMETPESDCEDGSCGAQNDENIICESPIQTDLEQISGEKELLARFRLKPPTLPNKDSLFSMCPKYLGHLERLKTKIIAASDIRDLLNNKEFKPLKHGRIKYFNIDRISLATNATTLLQNSNATLFKMKMRSGFPCFYCRHIFSKPKKLREHQMEHPKSTLFKLLAKYTADSLIVYADITDLKCTLCQFSMDDLGELKKHLVNEHGKKFDDIPDRVIPFKLKDKEANFDCQICGGHFETFGAIDKHMNVHYKNFICELCGSGFVTKHRLKVHTYLLHQKNKSAVRCEICKRVFATKNKYKIHNEFVHKKLKKMKCSLCEEKFIDYFTRQRHMEESHDVDRLVYKCSFCDKGYSRKYNLTIHVKRRHLQKKDFQCDLCPFMCFTKADLNKHMCKHGSGKKYECNVCKKLLSRKSSLNIHLRIHSNDRRYFCHLCGEGFVQNTSLKSHLKMHNEDVEKG